MSNQRWPLLETPGRFTERLSEAMTEMSLLGAVRHVLIENPPVITEVEVLKDWIRAEAWRTDTCTFDILREVCDGCRCKRAKEKE